MFFVFFVVDSSRNVTIFHRLSEIIIPLLSSKRTSQPELQRVGLQVLVARQDPRQSIARLDFEQDDLIVARRAQASGERQIDSIGDPLANRDPRGGIQPRRLLAVGIDERRRELKRIDPECLLDDFANLRIERLA